MSREFTEMIFMGDGGVGQTKSSCERLHERLQEGLELLSGSQQWTPPGRFGSPSGSTMEEWTEGQDKISDEIMEIVEDIAAALGRTVKRSDDETRFILEVETKRESWPPIKNGTNVVTTEANPEIDDWAAGALCNRQWGVKGTVVMHHDSHGLCYEVRHEDGVVGCYDPSELQATN